MTLISKLICDEFSVTAGEGATVTDSIKRDEKLRKVYVNDNCCIAFAGDIWITENLHSRGIYVPNTIEKFLNRKENINTCQELSNKLLELLCENNDKIDTELFISMNENGIIRNMYIKTIDKTMKNVVVNEREFAIQFSRYPEREYNFINNYFHKLWHDFFGSENNGRLLKDMQIHTEYNVCYFMDKFYQKVCGYSCFENIVIGKTSDIVMQNSNAIQFFKKENLTVKEMQ